MRGMRCKSLSNFKMQMSLSISLFFLSLCGLSFVAISAPSCRRFRAVSPVGIYPNRASLYTTGMSNIKDAPMVMVLLYYFSRYGAWHN